MQLSEEGRPRTALLRCAVASLVIAVLALALPPPAHAGETPTFRLEPYPLEVDGQDRRVFRFDLRPGTSVVDSVRLTNKTSEPREFRIYGADVTEDPSGGATEIAAHGDDMTGVGSWIDVADPRLTVSPGSSEVIRFSVSRPDAVDLEGAGAIVAEEIRPSATDQGIEVAFRVAILVDLSGEASGISADPPSLSVPVTLIPSRGTTGTTITNNATQATEVSVRFAVDGLTGRQWTLDPVEVHLQPGETRRVEATWNTVPRWGGFLRPTAEIVSSGTSLHVPGDRSLYPPVWFVAVAILAVGLRGLRELWGRRNERRNRREPPAPPGPDPRALRRRLIEAALWLHAAGQDAPRELRETTAAEARAVAAEARRTQGAGDIEHAALSLAAFANGLDDGDGAAQKAADDFDAWFREHRTIRV